MQGRKLNRDAGPLVKTAAVGRGTDRAYGPLVLVIVTSGFGRGQGCFAKHVVGLPEASRLETAAVRQRLGDLAPACNELFAQHPHCDVNACADRSGSPPRAISRATRPARPTSLLVATNLPE